MCVCSAVCCVVLCLRLLFLFCVCVDALLLCKIDRICVWFCCLGLFALFPFFHLVCAAMFFVVLSLVFVVVLLLFVVVFVCGCVVVYFVYVACFFCFGVLVLLFCTRACFVV